MKEVTPYSVPGLRFRTAPPKPSKRDYLIGMWYIYIYIYICLAQRGSHFSTVEPTYIHQIAGPLAYVKIALHIRAVSLGKTFFFTETMQLVLKKEPGFRGLGFMV